MATETWVLNETLIIDATVTYKVNFTTNNESKTSFEIRYVRGDKELQYDGSLVYSNGTWLQEAYRTVTFETAPTGDLLAWLQANGTKQSSTPRLSVDVSTLAGWANLSAGEKSITIVAKASGFKDSAPSAAVQVTKAAAMPAKGDIITLGSKQYRVLKTEGTVAEVLAMYDANTSIKFDAKGSNTYARGDLDSYCDTTFYNNLSIAMQDAIVPKTFQQDSWKWNGGSSAIANYAGTYGTSNYTLSLMSRTFGSSISRKCYVLSCQDVIDYLGVTTSMGSADTTLTSENVWKMFWNQTTSQGPTYPWLHSADASNSDYAFYPDGGNGSLNRDLVDNASAVRPAFQIDLSKISWS